ncbi:hypothetical protein BCR34DRAFT_603465 [Clohesyomyces aquaticus]|uniref:Uncharacterized protein n=1 Tax=Clohesyomyces aquaticus TaxID=1231657 RepID=A0A1Y1ZF66_9PLEO|nr:hypothetical protein BCR34DRAFT_603465 [Clohesyomyces aquaticus]
MEDPEMELLKKVKSRVSDALRLPDAVQVAEHALRNLCVRLECRKIVKEYANGSGIFYTESTFAATISLPLPGFVLHLQYGSDGASVWLTNEAPPDDQDLFTQIATLIDPNPNPKYTADDLSPKWEGIIDAPQFWFMSLVFIDDPLEEDETLEWMIGFIVRMEINSTLVLAGPNFSTGSKSFHGQLLFQGNLQDKLSPDYNEMFEIPATYEVPYDLDILSLFGDQDKASFPHKLLTRITQAMIDVSKSKSGDGTDPGPGPAFSLPITGTLTSDSPPGKDNSMMGPVPSPFRWKEVHFQISYENGFSFEFDTSFALIPRNPKFRTGSLRVGVEYDHVEKKWVLSGSARDIQFAVLADYLDPECSDALLSMLENLRIPSLSMF